jgi:hypothetical protein
MKKVLTRERISDIIMKLSRTAQELENGIGSNDSVNSESERHWARRTD